MAESANEFSFQITQPLINIVAILWFICDIHHKFRSKSRYLRKMSIFFCEIKKTGPSSNSLFNGE